MSDAVLKRVEDQILAAVPAYETYFLQVMGKAFRLKPPLFKTTPERFRVTFDSVEHANGAHQTPERLVLWIELNRAMGTCTVSSEWWQDTKELEPTARGEPRVDATPENLMAPAFAFGWLHKLVGGWSEGIEENDMANIEEVRMVQAEQLILKADEILKELDYVIEADSYESYANTLDNFLLTARLDEQVEGILSKVGKVVRKAAHAYGAAKGGISGASARWKAFKGTVKTAYKKGHEKGYKAARGGSDDGEGSKHAPTASTGKVKLKLVKGGGKRNGKMSDKEYKARYGKSRTALAASLDVPESDLEEMMSNLRDEVFEREFENLNVEELLALEKMFGLDENSDSFAVLAQKLGARGEVRDPAALVAWVTSQKRTEGKLTKCPACKGSGKNGTEKCSTCSGAGKWDYQANLKSAHAKIQANNDDKKKPKAEDAADAAAVSAYQRLSGLTMPMRSWSLPKLK